MRSAARRGSPVRAPSNSISSNRSSDKTTTFVDVPRRPVSNPSPAAAPGAAPGVETASRPGLLTVVPSVVTYVAVGVSGLGSRPGLGREIQAARSAPGALQSVPETATQRVPD